MGRDTRPSPDWNVVSKKYLVTVSYSGPQVGSHAQGEIVELSDEDARSLAPFIQLVDRANSNVENAEAAPPAEKAVKRASKGEKS